MSKWYHIDTKDIDLDSGGEVNLLITSDDQGNIYGILTYEQVRELYERIQKDNISVGFVGAFGKVRAILP